MTSNKNSPNYKVSKVSSDTKYIGIEFELRFLKMISNPPPFFWGGARFLSITQNGVQPAIFFFKISILTNFDEKANRENFSEDLVDISIRLEC